MEYQVTARKWRPQTFGDVIGQEHVTRALSNAIDSGKIPHAYLFSGPRGVGKTTTARILAKALNCEKGPVSSPCNECSVCRDIMNGSSIDVLEIDGASNRGIEDIREIRDNIVYMPISAKYKVYIIDEVHMLTKEASNALLKTLEEPPSHVVFIMATTEPHKVLPTIRSRCQHYVFKKLTAAMIVKQLQDISAGEAIQSVEEALYEIAHAADGSMRDAESIFDQAALYSDRNLTLKSVRELLGAPDEEYFDRLIAAIVKTDAVTVLETMKDYSDRVGDMKIFIRGLIDYFRSGLLVKKLPFDHDLVDFTESRYNKIKELFSAVEPEAIIRLMNLAIDTYRELRGDVEENFIIEIALFKMLDYRNMIPLSQLRQELLAVTAGQGAQPIKRSAMETPQKQTVETAPVQTAVTHHKIETPAQKQDELPKTSNPEEALRAILSKSVLMRVMVDHIETVKTTGKNIRVKMTNQKSSEYLNAMKRNIEAELKDMIQSEVIVDFVMDQAEEKPLFESGTVSNAEAVTADTEELSDDEVIPPSDTIDAREPETLTQDNNMPSSAIQSLFGGEIKR